MKGYVRNVSSFPMYAFKRSVAPGENVPAKEIYDNYFDVSGASNDAEFLDWLRTTVFREANLWMVNLSAGMEEEPAKPKTTSESDTDLNASRSKSHIVTTNVNVKQEDVDPVKVLKMSAEKCKVAVEEIDDVKLLKQMLAKASSMARKQKVCKIISDRLEELEH